MKKNLATVVAFAGATLLSANALAAEVLVTANIASSTTWTKNNTYNLQGQIYVLPGATLTIEPGKRNGEPVKFRMRVPITFPKGK